MTEPTLFDTSTPPAPAHACAGDACRYCRPSTTGEAARDRALAATARDMAWWHAADTWLASDASRFTADDLVAAIGLPAGSTNQVGARLRAWAVAGRIDPVGFTSATRKASHARVLRVWQVAS